MASPDIDIDLFEAQLRAIPREKRDFYVLTSDDDKALNLSRWISRNARVGQLHADALTELGLKVIDLSQVENKSSINHTKFVDSPEIVQLIGSRILAGDAYDEHARLGVGQSVIVGATGGLVFSDEAGG